MTPIVPRKAPSPAAQRLSRRFEAIDEALDRSSAALEDEIAAARAALPRVCLCACEGPCECHDSTSSPPEDGTGH